MPNPLLANVTAALEPGELSQPIYDESISKNIGYWLIKVTDKDEEKGIKAMAMLLGSEQEAKGIKAMLNSGKDFATLAKEYSQHESKSKGGELNWVKRGDMNSVAFDEVAFNLTLGEISEPVKDKSVQTKGGYWVVQLLDKGRHEPSEEVKQNLANKRFGEWLNDLEKKSTINNYLDEEKISWALNKVGKGG
jgi:parvulin-like peptidyl-prolyl isomerase